MKTELPPASRLTLRQCACCWALVSGAEFHEGSGLCLSCAGDLLPGLMRDQAHKVDGMAAIAERAEAVSRI
jgi:hypothetical protein